MSVTGKNSFTPTTFLALSCVGAALCPTYAAAETAPAAVVESPEAAQLRRDQIVVTGETYEDVAVNPKATQPILDTPQTITIVSDQVIRKQNLLTLRDVLATVPGITFGAGEGGGGYGDSINLRGYSANNDITQDGVRDSAQYSRTDPFNTQQVEVYNGANSVFNGSGSVGGTINLVSKLPQAKDLTIVEGGVGTDDYYRATVDSNVRVSDLAAVRLNAMYHRNDVPGRDVEKYDRWGVAPSVTLGVGGPTQLTLAYFHQEDDNTPIYGVPYVLNEINGGPLPGVDDSDYFGIRNLDRQKIKVDRLTAIFSHELTDSITFRNLTRWQRVSQLTQSSAPQGTFCLASTGLQPVTAVAGGTVGAACPAGLAPGFYRPSGPRGLSRDQVNDLLYNQSDLRIVSGEKGGIRNTLVVGVAFTQEDYALRVGQLLRNPGGATPDPVQPDINLANPNTVWTGPTNYVLTGVSDGRTSNAAVYAFDTLELGKVELNGGVRYETVRNRFRADTVGTPATGALYTRGPDQNNKENLFSWRAGIVYKPVETVSLYAAYANSKTPSAATVRLGCTNVCDLPPEKGQNYEVGAKASLLGGKLQTTTALFRNERTNFRVATNDPAQPFALAGRMRVDGLALGVTGNVTPEWLIFANYTYLKSKVLQNAPDGFNDPVAGGFIVQTPKHSGSLFTSYRLPFGLEIGYGLTYQGKIATAAATANQRQFFAGDYLIHRAFLSYDFGSGLTAQLNIQNFTDEDYYTSIRSNTNATTGVVTGGWAAPGEARSARLSLFYSF